jgi:hypothetical protein
VFSVFREGQPPARLIQRSILWEFISLGRSNIDSIRAGALPARSHDSESIHLLLLQRTGSMLFALQVFWNRNNTHGTKGVGFWKNSTITAVVFHVESPG